MCRACEAGSFALSQEAHGFMTAALGSPLAQAPQASRGALRQVDRAIRETAEHHAHLRLAPTPG